MEYTIEYYSDQVEAEILALPPTLAARYLHLTERMHTAGPNLGEPHTKAMKDGLFEMRLKGQEGIGRVFYCVIVGRKIIVLHSFIKKSQKTPAKELTLARKRLEEVKHHEPRGTAQKNAGESGGTSRI